MLISTITIHCLTSAMLCSVCLCPVLTPIATQTHTQMNVWPTIVRTGRVRRTTGMILSTPPTQTRPTELLRRRLRRPSPNMPKTISLLSGWELFVQPNFVTISCLQVFLKDPYYQKLTRAETMSTITFLGAAGGWLGLCCGLSIISVVCHLSFFL